MLTIVLDRQNEHPLRIVLLVCTRVSLSPSKEDPHKEHKQLHGKCKLLCHLGSDRILFISTISQKNRTFSRSTSIPAPRNVLSGDLLGKSSCLEITLSLCPFKVFLDFGIS